MKSEELQEESNELQLVVLSNLMGKTSAKATLADTFQDAINALQKAKIEYVLAGALAYGLYAKSRYTKDIDLIAMGSESKQIKDIFQKAGFKLVQEVPYQLTFMDLRNKAEIDVLLGAIDPEHSAVEDSVQKKVFGVPALVIKPEYLLWMYCLSDRAQHAVDAIHLIEGGKVDLTRLRRLMKYAQDDVAEEQLNTLLERVKGQKRSYSEMVAYRKRKEESQYEVDIKGSKK